MTTPAASFPVSYPDDAVLGPDSLIWRYFGDSRVMLFLGTGLIVQTAHPVIGKAVDEHSDFRTDAYGRLKRSLDLLWPVIYNDVAGAREYGRMLRERHRDIKGTGYDGKPYHSLNPEPYLWVHMTAYTGIIHMAESFGEPLSPAQQEQLFQEWLQMGRQMGIRDKDMPADVPAYWAYWDKMVEERLAWNPVLEYLLREEYFRKRPKPPVALLPDALWAAVRAPFGSVLYLTTRAAMTPAFREKFNVPWSSRDERHFKRLMKIVNATHRFLPERAKWLPPAWKAVADAHRHPEKYRRSPLVSGQGSLVGAA